MKNKVRNYKAKEIYHFMKSYQPELMAYQEIKTLWGNRNTKVTWSMQLKTRQSTLHNGK